MESNNTIIPRVVEKGASRSQLKDEQVICIGEIGDKYPQLWDDKFVLKKGYLRTNELRQPIWEEIAKVLVETPCFEEYKDILDAEWIRNTYRALTHLLGKTVRNRLNMGSTHISALLTKPTEIAFRRHVLCSLAGGGSIDLKDYPLDGPFPSGPTPSPSERTRVPSKHKGVPIERYAPRKAMTDEQMIALGELVDKYPQLWDETGYLNSGYLCRTGDKQAVWGDIANILVGIPCFENFKEYITTDWTRITYVNAKNAVMKRLSVRLEQGASNTAELFTTHVDAAFRRHILCHFAGSGVLELEDYPLDAPLTLIATPTVSKSPRPMSTTVDDNDDSHSPAAPPSSSSDVDEPAVKRPTRTAPKRPSTTRKSPAKRTKSQNRTIIGSNEAGIKACNAYGRFIGETLKTMPTRSYLKLRQQIDKLVQAEEMNIHTAHLDGESD